MDIPDMFLLAEAILLGLDNITDGLVVYPKRIQSRVLEELPFMITESVSLCAPAALASCFAGRFRGLCSFFEPGSPANVPCR